MFVCLQTKMPDNPVMPERVLILLFDKFYLYLETFPYKLFFADFRHITNSPQVFLMTLQILQNFVPHVVERPNCDVTMKTMAASDNVMNYDN